MRSSCVVPYQDAGSFSSLKSLPKGDRTGSRLPIVRVCVTSVFINGKFRKKAAKFRQKKRTTKVGLFGTFGVSGGYVVSLHPKGSGSENSWIVCASGRKSHL